MTTTNERTVPSPEMDEELTQFINTLVKGVSDEKAKSWYKGDLYFYYVAKEVAAFSDRRATESMEKKVRESREKAIEEIRDFAKNYDISAGDKIHPLREQYRQGMMDAAEMLEIRTKARKELSERHSYIMEKLKSLNN